MRRALGDRPVLLDILLTFAATVTDGAPHMLIGHSAGAYYAQAMAVRASAQVAGLALICPLLSRLRDVPERRAVVGSGAIGDEGFRSCFVIQIRGKLERYERMGPAPSRFRHPDPAGESAPVVGPQPAVGWSAP